MRRNGYLWTSGVNFDTDVRFADPDFLLECKISAIWRRFLLNFAFYMLNVRHISTSGLFDLLIYKVYHSRRPPTSIISTKFKPPTPILSWVMSDNVSHWLPLKMRTLPLRMRRITWPGVKNNYIFGIPDPDLPIHYTTFIGLRRRLRVVYSRAVQC